MGQAAVDLPDPRQSLATPSAPPSADDLLSQLAGEEIDRLLAEADEEKDSLGAHDTELGTGEVAENSPPAAAEPTPPISARLDTTSSTEKSADIHVHPPSGSATGSAGSEAQLDALFNELTRSAGSEPLVTDAPGATESAPPATDTPDAAESSSSPSSAAEIAELSVDRELAALIDESPPQKVTVASLGEAASQQVDEPASTLNPQTDREALLVRLLEWINLPITNLSDRLRDALGNIAILTLFNAMAVLLYILLFRRT